MEILAGSSNGRELYSICQEFITQYLDIFSFYVISWNLQGLSILSCPGALPFYFLATNAAFNHSFMDL